MRCQISGLVVCWIRKVVLDTISPAKELTKEFRPVRLPAALVNEDPLDLLAHQAEMDRMVEVEPEEN